MARHKPVEQHRLVCVLLGHLEAETFVDGTALGPGQSVNATIVFPTSPKLDSERIRHGRYDS